MVNVTSALAHCLNNGIDRSILHIMHINVTYTKTHSVKLRNKTVYVFKNKTLLFWLTSTR